MLLDVRSAVIVGSSVLVGLGLIGLWALSSRPPVEERAPISYVDDPASIGTALELDRLGILTAENFVGNRIRIIEGSFRNTGDRTIRSVELHLAFHDSAGAVVYEETGEALRVALPADETRRYEFRFENLPETWNFRIPTVTVARLGY
jgi:hypothetical protein